jgi:hypothetical protein
VTRNARAVAIGGGTGLPRVLTALLDDGYDVTGVVTVADDGGSSGALRREFGILPPGDARNCLVALAEPGSVLADVFQYRFPHGEGLAGHALGNLVIAALTDIAGGFPAALDAAASMLGARGRVLPSTTTDVVLVDEMCEGGRIAGQAAANRATVAAAEAVRAQVRQGEPLAVAMEHAGHFPPVLRHMAAVGEETGDLPRMLLRVADSLDFEVDNAMRRLTTALEPAIVLFTGGFVGFIVLSILLPIFQANSAVK